MRARVVRQDRLMAKSAADAARRLADVLMRNETALDSDDLVQSFATEGPPRAQ